MSESEFRILCLVAFTFAVGITTIGFIYFVRWRKRVLNNPVPLEDLKARAAALDARYRKLHPEMDDDFSSEDKA